ncbi:hypothetical protein LAZ67_16001303 [Cordylochernes scorpioides]|uniref:TIL domain-containing protein n=1 Tax=Cordylochernes scorpioides TaxID=51811 RepID=A0ABY6LB83_9ARAC|nr:hypothetical protein LAZ67_16001303 [Cordylochernes scorpioides]
MVQKAVAAGVRTAGTAVAVVVILLIAMSSTICYSSCLSQCKRSLYAGGCGVNQVYEEECGKICDKTCDNYMKPPPHCNHTCRPRCICREGYVRNAAWECVRPSQCPPIDSKGKLSHSYVINS